MNEALQSRLELAFPASTDPEIYRGVSEGILLADQVIRDTPILHNSVGRDLRGLIRRAGVMFRLHDLCQAGDLPFQAEMVRMQRGSMHCIEIRSEGMKAHVCRTDGPDAFPVDSLSRQDERLVNQPDLFAGNVVSFEEISGKVPSLYALLTLCASRSGILEHLCWGVPSADGGDWLAHGNVLLRSPHVLAGDGGAINPEQPAQRVVLRFQEHIEKSLAEENEESKK